MKKIAWVLVILVILAVGIGAIWSISGKKTEPSSSKNWVTTQVVASPPATTKLLPVPAVLDPIVPALSPNPETVLLLTKEFAARPPSSSLALLSSADLPQVFELYGRADTLAKRRGLLWALGFIGGKEAVAVLRRNLLEEHRDESLSRQQEDVITDIILALGFAAQENGEAYEILLKGTEPAFWQKAKNWQSPRGAYSTNLLVSYSLQAIGIAGRKDALGVIEAFKTRDPSYLYDYGSSVAQAAFNLHLQTKHGRNIFRMKYSQSSDLSVFDAWANGEGKAWVEWANSTRRGPRPSKI